jgi:hypothetical protein
LSIKHMRKVTYPRKSFYGFISINIRLGVMLGYFLSIKTRLGCVEIGCFPRNGLSPQADDMVTKFQIDIQASPSHYLVWKRRELAYDNNRNVLQIQRTIDQFGTSIFNSINIYSSIL